MSDTIKIDSYDNGRLDAILSTPSDNILYDKGGTLATARQHLLDDWHADMLRRADVDYMTCKRKRIDKWSDFYFSLYQADVAQRKKRHVVHKTSVIGGVA